MKVVLVDAYDSFVHLIDQHLRAMGLKTSVIRCDDAALAQALAQPVDFVVLGPGPGRPEEADYPRLLKMLEGRVPVLGVCLGHQAIGLAYGGEVVGAGVCVHGKTSVMLNDGEGVFAHTGGRPFAATRYHSLVVRDEGLPDDLVVSARSRDDAHVMGLRHRRFAIEGVQFHPESIRTEGGASIFSSFIDQHVAGRAGRGTL